MPPQKPPAPKSGKLPAWAWVVAIGAGGLIGLFLLRGAGGGAAEEDTDYEEGGAGSGDAGGATVVAPIGSDSWLSGMGLTPPEAGGGGGGGGETSESFSTDGYYLGPGAGGQEGGDYVDPTTVWGSSSSSSGASSPRPNPAPSFGSSNVGGTPTQTATVAGAGRHVDL